MFGYDRPSTEDSLSVIIGRKRIDDFTVIAAVANITAADMTERGEFDDIYAYLFGVPRTTKEPGAYKGIYNICGQYDPVTDTPFQTWGYERYGTDLFTPAQESDPYYGKHRAAAAYGKSNA